MNSIQRLRKQLFWLLLTTMITLLICENYGLFPIHLSYPVLLFCGASVTLCLKLAYEVWGKVALATQDFDSLTQGQGEALSLEETQAEQQVRKMANIEAVKIEETYRIRSMKRRRDKEEAKKHRKEEEVVLDEWEVAENS